ncbi:unnamed protein product [Allacma fusca]|uniref:Uncharacterized protein n=1 Tax=Allacma fusca TaxID=39272 RepID=A0A8J2LJ12_9HEXA|nr:unnamed protein product [Allacma fusca]
MSFLEFSSKLRHHICVVHFVITSASFDLETELFSPQQESRLYFSSQILDEEAKSSKLVIVFRKHSGNIYFLTALLDRIRKVNIYLPIFVQFIKPANKIFQGYMHWYEQHCQAKYNCIMGNCLDIMERTYNEATNYGKKMKWTMFNKQTFQCFNSEDGSKFVKSGDSEYQPHVFAPKGTKPRSPLARKSPWRLFDTMYEFLVADLDSNLTFCHEEGNVCETCGFPDPATIYVQNVNSDLERHYSEFKLSLTPALKFITSDSVSSVKIEFALYTEPFEGKIWACVAFLILFLAFVLSVSTIITSESRNFLQEFSIKAFALLGNLIDQGQDTLEKDIRSRACAMSTIVALWLMSTILLSNGYKGFLKTLFSLENEMETKWKSLEELKNFTLYFPAWDDVDDFLGPYFTVGQKRCKAECLSIFGTPTFIFGNGVDAIELNGTELRRKFGIELRCFQYQHLLEITVKNLTLPQTALVVFSYDIDHYWNRVQRKIIERKLKFAPSLRAQSSTYFQQPISIFIPALMEHQYKNVERRAGVMLSNGLFWLWEKWDQIRFPRCLQTVKLERMKEENFQALSLQSSFILAFYAFLWSNLASSSVLIIELLIPLLSQKIPRVKFVKGYLNNSTKYSNYPPTSK